MSLNLLGGITVQLSLLVSGIVLARALGPANRGNLALLTLVTSIAWQLGGLGIPFSITYASARTPGAAQRILDSLGRSMAIQAIAAALAAGIILLPLTADRPAYVRIGAAMTALAIAPTVYERCGLGTLQGLERFVSFNILRVLQNVLFSTIAIVLWLSHDRDFLPYAGAWAFSQSVFAPVTMWFARKAAKQAETGVGSQPTVKELLHFGRKSLFGGAPPVEAYRLDQSVVALFLAPAELGYYVAALSFTNLPRFIAQSFSFVSTPAVARRPTHSAAVREMWKFFWMAMPFYLGVITVLWLGAPELVRFFFGPAFSQAGHISRILLVATALFCGRRVLVEAARGAAYPGIGSIAELASFLSVFPLFALIVPHYGLEGVAWSLVGSSTIGLAVLMIGLLVSGARGRVPASWEQIHGAASGPT